MLPTCSRNLLTICLACAASFVATTLVAAEPAKVPREGYKPPDFTLATLDGREVTLYKLLKESSVVLVVLRGYPGYQCPLCSVQVGDLLKNAERFAKANSKVVLVYPGPQDALAAKAAEFVKNRELPEHFLLVTDPDYMFTNEYGLRWDAPRETAYPATFVIDRQGTIRFAKTSKTHGDRASAEEVLKFVPGAD
ncbi:MAG: peroxiredoxin family protein [Pirellulales bacterium]